MPDRREFLASAGLVALAGGWNLREALASLDSTWMTYAPDAERFRAELRFLERLKKLSEAGFSRYEFGRWKAKDVDAIAKLDDELGLQPVLFTGYPGLRGSRWKEGLIEAVEDSAQLSMKLGSAKVGVFAPDRDEKLDRDDQLDALVESLREAAEKVDETEAVLVVEAGRAAGPNAPKPLLESIGEIADVIKDVGSDRVKFAFEIGRADVVAGKLPELIKARNALVGHYRLVDFGKVDGAEAAYAKVIRAIHDVGHPDPIGVALPSKGDPTPAIEALRKLDDAAKALAG